jgi:hypothetical protein
MVGREDVVRRQRISDNVIRLIQRMPPHRYEGRSLAKTTYREFDR